MTGPVGSSTARSRRARRWGAVAVLVVMVASGCQATSSAPGYDADAAPYADRVVERGFRLLLGRSPVAWDRAHWQPRVTEAGSAGWFVRALLSSDEYRAGLGRLSNGPFVDEAYRRARGRAPTEQERAAALQMLRDRPSSRGQLLADLVVNGFSFRLTPPSAVTDCVRFDRTGLRPLCAVGSAGDQRGVSIAHVAGTNIYVNKAWLVELDGFVREARSRGFDLQAVRDPSVPAWMFSPGSWRSWDDQQWLYDHGYPANRPGRSLHEWGLAVDLACNGQTISRNRTCWDWARANGPRHGVFLFHTVRRPGDSEAWHFSSNGL